MFRKYSDSGLKKSFKPTKLELCLLLFLAFGSLWFGARMGFESVEDLLLHFDSKSWKSTDGVLDFVVWDYRGRRVTRIGIMYRYEVAGRTYRGTRLTTSGNYANIRSDRDRYAHLQEGVEVPVLYDPEAPEQSALFRVDRADLVLGTVWTGCLCILGFGGTILFAYFAFHRPKSIPANGVDGEDNERSND